MKVFIWFFFFLPIVYAAGNFDYFQLVQQWPPTVCSGIQNCDHPELQNFTIHGLWPSDSCKPAEPLNCSGSPFDDSRIDDLIPQLIEHWPNITTGDDLRFWENQWGTHGTCLENRFDEFEYFFKALELKINVGILGYLNDAGINPLPPKVVYRSSEISDAIEHGTGRKPRLRCKDNLLLEISVCYDLDLAYIDCPPQLMNNPTNKCAECVGFPPAGRFMPHLNYNNN